MEILHCVQDDKNISFANAYHIVFQEYIKDTVLVLIKGSRYR
jgi:hypothetical protein